MSEKALCKRKLLQSAFFVAPKERKENNGISYIKQNFNEQKYVGSSVQVSGRNVGAGSTSEKLQK